MNQINEFLNSVRSAKHAGNTTMLANMRKAEYKSFYAFPFIKDYCDVTNSNDVEIMATLAFVSSVVISNNRETFYGNLGQTLASLYSNKQSDTGPRKYHQTFIRIIESQNVKMFCSLIRSAVKHAISKDKNINLQLLGEDMFDFANRKTRESVINSWCRGYLNS